MFKKFEIDEYVLNHNWKDEDAEYREVARKTFAGIAEFEKVPCYDPFAWLYAYCLKGHFHVDGNLFTVMYGYALDVASIEKFVLDNYGDDPNEYMLCANLMPMDYEKYYKNGTFIGLDGKDTHEDFYDLEDCDELEKKAQCPGNWIAFTVYDINKNSAGKPWKEDPERLKLLEKWHAEDEAKDKNTK